MNVIVNERSLEIAAHTTLVQLFDILGKTGKGSAVAVNQEIISRSLWADYKLCEGDQIALFQAIAGG